MAKDDRLYGKFTQDFADNPKILPLSDAAFRCLVEATLYSRRMLTDGFLATRLATAKWPLAALDELATNDPIKPSFLVVDGGWMIHDYAEHQDTKAEVEARRSRNAANGRKGGIARAKQVASKSPSEIQAETETEAETTTSNEVVKTPVAKPATRGARLPEPFMVTREMRDWAAEKVPGLDVNEATESFVDYWRGRAGAGAVKVDWPATWRNSLRSAHGRTGSSRPARKPKAEQVLDVIEQGRRMQEAHDRKAIGA